MENKAGALAHGRRPASANRLKPLGRAARVLSRKPRLRQTSQPAIHPPPRIRNKPPAKQPCGVCGSARPTAVRGGKPALIVCGAIVARAQFGLSPTAFAPLGQTVVETPLVRVCARLRQRGSFLVLFCIVIQTAEPRPLRAMATVADRAPYRQTPPFGTIASALTRRPSAELTRPKLVVGRAAAVPDVPAASWRPTLQTAVVVAF